jgi:hypothetical protein
MILLLLFSLVFLLTYFCVFHSLDFFIFEQTRLGVKIACSLVVLFFLPFQLGGFDWFIVSNHCITEVAIVLLLILQPVNYTSNIVAGDVAFLSRFCLQSVNCRSSNYNHAKVVIVLVRRSLIDSLLATAVLQKLQSPYFWSCNRSSRHNYTVFVGVVAFFVAFFCNRLIVGVATIITAEVVIVVLDRNFFTYIFFV